MVDPHEEYQGNILYTERKSNRVANKPRQTRLAEVRQETARTMAAVFFLLCDLLHLKYVRRLSVKGEAS